MYPERPDPPGEDEDDEGTPAHVERLEFAFQVAEDGEDVRGTIAETVIRGAETRENVQAVSGLLRLAHAFATAPKRPKPQAPKPARTPKPSAHGGKGRWFRRRGG